MTQASSYSAPRPRIPRWTWLVAAAVILLLLILKPPFVIKALARPGSSPEATQSKGAQFADKVWASKVLPVIQEKAQDMTMIVQEIRIDPAAAGQPWWKASATTNGRSR